MHQAFNPLTLPYLTHQAAKHLGLQEHQLDLYMWPEMFPNSAGPRRDVGVVMHAFWSYPVVGFQPTSGLVFQEPVVGLAWCDGVWVEWSYSADAEQRPAWPHDAPLIDGLEGYQAMGRAAPPVVLDLGAKDQPSETFT